MSPDFMEVLAFEKPSLYNIIFVHVGQHLYPNMSLYNQNQPVGPLISKFS